MVSEQDTRFVVRRLRAQGWVVVATAGSHSKWRGPNGTTFSLPDGHRTISPGVYRKLLAAFEEDRRR